MELFLEVGKKKTHHCQLVVHLGVKGPKPELGIENLALSTQGRCDLDCSKLFFKNVRICWFRIGINGLTFRLIKHLFNYSKLINHKNLDRLILFLNFHCSRKHLLITIQDSLFTSIFYLIGHASQSLNWQKIDSLTQWLINRHQEIKSKARVVTFEENVTF